MTISKPGDDGERRAEAEAKRVLLGTAPPAKKQTGSAILPGHSGQALEGSVRELFGARFGHDLSQVRIHTGTSSWPVPRTLGAKAYTVGSDIVFDEGRFAPQTSEGRQLLAHELAHVVEQSERPNSPRRVQRVSADSTDPQLLQLQAAIQAQPLPQDPGYAELAQEHKARLLDLVAMLIRLQTPEGATDPTLRESISAAATLAADARAWNFSGFSMTHGEGLAEALIEAGLAEEGIRIWDEAYAGTEPPNAVERDPLHAQFLRRMLASLPVPSVDDPQASLRTFFLVQRLYVTTSSLNDDPTRPDIEPVAETKRMLLPQMLAGVQGFIAGVISGAFSDLALIDRVLERMREAGAHSAEIAAEEIEITLSDFGTQPLHKDVFAPQDATRQMPFEFYNDASKRDAHELRLPVATILTKVQDQLGLLALVGKTRPDSGPHPFENDDSLRIWAMQLYKEGASAERPLAALVAGLKNYFAVFTVHSDYNLSDRDVHYLNRPFPRALTGEMIQDCGIYAMRIAYILSLVAQELGLHFYWIEMPVHLALAITGPGWLVGKSGRERLLYAVHNGQFFEIDERADPSEEEIGSWAAATFVPQAELPGAGVGLIDVPFRVTGIEDPTGATEAPDERYQRRLINTYASRSSEPLAGLADAGLQEADYLGVAEAYRDFAIEAPLRFLPVASVIFDELSAELRRIDSTEQRESRKRDAWKSALSEADRLLVAAFDENAGSAASVYSRERELLHEKLKGVPTRQGWAIRDKLAAQKDLPTWYENHLYITDLLQKRDTRVATDTLMNTENPYRLALQNMR